MECVLLLTFVHLPAAHEAAYKLKDVLHRDISEGNILIAKIPGKKGQVEGLLIDWDLCIEIKRFASARRKSRTVRNCLSILCSTPIIYIF